MANDNFSEPPRRADSKNPIFFFSRFLGLGHHQGLGVRLGRILGVLSIEPFLGEGGGSSRRALSTPPPETKTRPPMKFFLEEKMQFLTGPRNWRSILGTQPFFLASAPPPPSPCVGHGRHSAVAGTVPLKRLVVPGPLSRGRTATAVPCGALVFLLPKGDVIGVLCPTPESWAPAPPRHRTERPPPPPALCVTAIARRAAPGPPPGHSPRPSQTAGEFRTSAAHFTMSPGPKCATQAACRRVPPRCIAEAEDASDPPCSDNVAPPVPRAALCRVGDGFVPLALSRKPAPHTHSPPPPPGGCSTRIEGPGPAAPPYRPSSTREV